MKKLFIFIVIIVCPIYLYSQNCFGEYNNTVSSLACVNATASFEINYQAAIINNQQDVFVAYYDNINHPIKSWKMMDKSGNFFNIHQYGFYDNGIEIMIAYKIIRKYTIADLAIVINGQPFYHNQNCEIYTDQRTNWNDIEGNGLIGNQKSTFVVTLDGSNIVGIKIGETSIVRHNEINSTN